MVTCFTRGFSDRQITGITMWSNWKIRMPSTSVNIRSRADAVLWHPKASCKVMTFVYCPTRRHIQCQSKSPPKTNLTVLNRNVVSSKRFCRREVKWTGLADWHPHKKKENRRPCTLISIYEVTQASCSESLQLTYSMKRAYVGTYKLCISYRPSNSSTWLTNMPPVSLDYLRSQFYSAFRNEFDIMQASTDFRVT